MTRLPTRLPTYVSAVALMTIDLTNVLRPEQATGRLDHLHLAGAGVLAHRARPDGSLSFSLEAVAAPAGAGEATIAGLARGRASDRRPAHRLRSAQDGTAADPGGDGAGPAPRSRRAGGCRQPPVPRSDRVRRSRHAGHVRAGRAAARASRSSRPIPCSSRAGGPPARRRQWSLSSPTMRSLRGGCGLPNMSPPPATSLSAGDRSPSSTHGAPANPLPRIDGLGRPLPVIAP